MYNATMFHACVRSSANEADRLYERMSDKRTLRTLWEIQDLVYIEGLIPTFFIGTQLEILHVSKKIN